MSQKAVYSRLSTRIAEEKQLLAEEKWIIEALNKLRSQRNGLQIERLELESLKTQLILKHRNLMSPTPSPSSETMTVDSAVKPMTRNPPASRTLNTELEQAPPNPLSEEAYCNEQELNLAVTNPVLSLNYQNLNAEEEEDDPSEESHDESTSDNMLIDMNMFMNGNIPM